MKNSILYLILIITTICSQNIVSQITNEIKSFESKDGKIIKLLADYRVLLEVTEKVEYPDSTSSIMSTSNDGKKICGLRIGYIIYQSYGTYELTDSNLILNFIDENPIEKVSVQTSKYQKTKNKTHITIISEKENRDDLIIKQNGIEICRLIFFDQQCSFILDSINEPLIIEYNQSKKELKLNSEFDSEIRISINDLKVENQIRNQTLIYELNNLTENNKR